jgi:DNA topoisomerase-1
MPFRKRTFASDGYRLRKRKQYKYHPNWNALRNHTKFYRLYAFGTALPSLRVKMEKDLALPALPQEKVLATIVSLMERTNIRIGNNSYEKIYGSYGITTFKDKHVKIAGNSLKFSFKGKKGVYHDISIQSKRLAGIVKKCQDIPGKELFQYIDDNGQRRTVDSGMVNDYIKTISGGDFTAKDLEPGRERTGFCST